MTLHAYLRERGLTYEAFGNLIDVSAQAVWRYTHGRRHPRPEIMRRIIAATDGAVGPQDFLDACDPTPESKDAA